MVQASNSQVFSLSDAICVCVTACASVYVCMCVFTT